ncbi:cation:proton antiporter [Kiloniella laminariae]|uniref:Cation:proton antiporter n=1 Tax=Kiloniella laminariae TaxID=454162 RepID=A0ABT4LEB9_9PROT|nr:cation:proton antiporter [Kiloniella laminariae]MCZ4279441.1 cation:proton antiporter [Kiloniella laminariae]
MPISDIVLTIAALLVVIACSQPLARRSGLPFTVVLAMIGVLLALAAKWLLYTTITDQFNEVASLVIDIPVSSATFLDIMLPILLFQGAVTIDVRRLAKDTAPVILLAVLGVVVALVIIGGAVSFVSSAPLVVCLLFGAIVATTDPSAVIALFRDLGAPARLTRLVEGESLLNDATAIAAFSAFLALTISGGKFDLLNVSSTLSVSLAGGIAVGLIAGRVTVQILAWLRSFRAAQVTITVALPYLIYTLANNYIHISGVVAVVTAGLVLSAFARSRFQSETFRFFQDTLDQLSWWAGSLVFILAALLVPGLLADVQVSDLWITLVAVFAALVARAVILFGVFPILSATRLTQSISTPTKTVIIWGGLRGAVTLALALAVTENPLVDPETKRFIAIQATGFALFTLLIQGTTLTALMRWLGLDQLSPIERAFRSQVLSQSLSTVKSSLRNFAGRYQLDDELVETAMSPYSERLSKVAKDRTFEETISDKERLTLGLVALANQEKSLLFDPRWSAGVPHILIDQYLLAVDAMIDAAREDGRLGYLRAARKPHKHSSAFRILGWCHARMGINRPLAQYLGRRFQLLLINRIMVLELGVFLDTKLKALLGDRPAEILGEILRQRQEEIERHLAGLRLQYPRFARTLDHALLERFAYREEVEQIDNLREAGIISEDLARSLIGEAESIHAVVKPRSQVDFRATTSELLVSFPVFSELSQSELDEITKSLRTRVFADDAFIFRKGDKADGLYFIASGAVEIRIGERVVRLGHGDFFGEMALLAETRRSADIRSISYSHLLLLEANTFHKLVKAHPHWRSRLDEVAKERRAMNEAEKLAKEQELAKLVAIVTKPDNF